MTTAAHPFFLPYQRRWIEDRSRLKLMEKSRQIGISWTTAYACVRRHLPDSAGTSARYDTWVSSRDETQARLFLEDCRSFAQVLNLGIRDFGHTLLADAARSRQLTLAFSSGNAIHSLSSNADAQAGKRGTRVLDEFALHQDPRRLYAIAYPGITWGGQLEIISTHRGRHNFFNTLIEQARHDGNPKNFSLHRVTLTDALEQGFLQKLKAKLPADDYRQEMDAGEYYDFIRNGCADAATFAQEYECVPYDDDSAFLDWDWIEACEYPAATDWDINARLSSPHTAPAPAIPHCAPSSPTTALLHTHTHTHAASDNTASAFTSCSRDTFPTGSPVGDCYLGIDIGRSHDLTVFWLLERVGDVLCTRALQCLKGVPFARQEAVLDSYLQLPTLRRTAIDQSGLGRQFAERASARYGAHRIKALSFTAAVKEQIAYPLRHALEARRLRIPADNAVRADLHSIRKEPSEGGHIRLSAARGTDGHGDRFWALALALHAAEPAAQAGGPAHFQSLSLFTRSRG